ncbi:hypothetical protein CCR97_26655 [Rhodoplanes elegans]|uniref:Uncharacterized protein n=1 Tax=Rhodoplanes elegans TaxID=29408 RepID=A0A327K600_9BRAD|nr:hypothetical protein [Rhodoplanes elegans]MBK5961760.1 hypothetical protein [Rhodoplanes elegans]RAI34089.1 hypothetical protein CH338_21485 [Rhodoplanes elegans]
MQTIVRLAARHGGAARAGIVSGIGLGVAVMIATPALADGSAGRAAPRVVAGPIVGGLAANNGYYAYGPYAAPGSPVAWRALPWSDLYGPAVPVAPGCWMQRQRVWTEYGWRWRTGPICY